MKSKEKAILIIGIFSLVSLTAYCLHLSLQLEKNEALTEDLISSLNKNYDKLYEVSNSLRQLTEEFMQLSAYDTIPLYLSYTANASESLHRNINEIIEAESYHYGVKWIANRTEFINPSLALVEYNDGHNQHHALIQVLKTDGGYSFQELK